MAMGFFDINLAFAQSGTGRLQAGELIRFDITLAGITANNFNTTSILESGNQSTHCTAVHAGGLTDGKSDFLGALVWCSRRSHRMWFPSQASCHYWPWDF